MMPKLKASAYTFAGICVLIFALLAYDGNYKVLEFMYLHHLAAKEEAANSKVGAAITQNQCDAKQPIDAFLACMNKFANDLGKASDQKSAIHHQRLWLEVKWGFADSTDDAKELGWNYPRAQWDGHNWSCPPGTSPYSIGAERDAGASEYTHCLTEKEVSELGR